MATNLIGATDSILGAIKTAWDANAAAANNGALPPLLFEATEPDLRNHPSQSGQTWARAVVRHGTGQPGPIMGALGKQRHWRGGIVWVQLFVAYKGSEAFTTAQALASVARKAYEGKRAGSVVFNPVVVREQGTEGPWLRVDVLANFIWDEITPSQPEPGPPQTFTGHGAPSDAIGADGDFYFDVDSDNVYQKANGTWS